MQKEAELKDLSQTLETLINRLNETWKDVEPGEFNASRHVLLAVRDLIWARKKLLKAADVLVRDDVRAQTALSELEDLERELTQRLS